MNRRIVFRQSHLLSSVWRLLWPARRTPGGGRVRRRSRHAYERALRSHLAGGQALEPRLALSGESLAGFEPVASDFLAAYEGVSPSLSAESFAFGFPPDAAPTAPPGRTLGSSIVGEFAGQVDVTPPTVAASSIADGDVLPVGMLEYVVTFSEAMDPASLTLQSFWMYDVLGREYAAPASVTPSTDSLGRSVATVVFGNLAESRFELEIFGPTDLAGNALVDQGNGVPWHVPFSTDTPTSPFGPLAPAAPLGGLVYRSAQEHRTVLADATDVDDVTITLAPGGSVLSAIVAADPSLQVRVDVIGADGSTVLASHAATVPGEQVVVGPVDVAVGGTFTLRYAPLAGTTGVVRTSLLLDALLESEAPGDHTNDTIAGAESLVASLVTAGTARRAAVVGALVSNSLVFADGFEGGVLDGAWTTYSSLAGGRTEVSDWEESSGRYSLLMDHNDPLAIAANLNEAVLSVDLSGITGTAILDFAHMSVHDEVEGFAGVFTGHFNADGIAISADGLTWHPVWEPTDDGWSWGRHTLDLSAAAATAGIPLGAGFQVKFQQYGADAYDFDGRFWDDIMVRDFVRDIDTHAIELAAGETLSAYLVAADAVSLSLLDAGGTLVAGGVALGNYESVVTSYTSATGGTYHLVVTTPPAQTLDADLDYVLTAVVGGRMEVEPNDDILTAQTVAVGGTVLASLGGEGIVIDGHIDVPGDPISFGFDSLGHFGGILFSQNWTDEEFGFQSTWTLQLSGTNYNTQDRPGVVETVTFPVVVTGRTAGGTSLLRVEGQPLPDVMFERLISWRTGDDHAIVTTTLRNASAAEVMGVKLLESQNPDPDFVWETANDVTRGGRLVVATAFGLSIGLATNDPRAVVSAQGADILDGQLSIDPDEVLTAPVDPNGATADTALNVAFALGNLSAGGSVSCTFAILFGYGQNAIESQFDALDIAPVAWEDVDTYAITATAGELLQFETLTPGDRMGDSPDVRMELLDAAGVVLASDDNGAADGTNALLTHRFTDAGTYSIRVSASANPNVRTTGSYALAVTADAAPTVAITSSAPALKAGETATITFTLSEASTSFAAGDVSVTGGTLTAFSGSGTDYVATFTPTANSTVSGTVTVAAGSFTDAAGNGNVAGALAPPITIDTVAPTVAITSSAPALKAGETATITFTLSEASTSFAVGDVSVTGGTLTGFSGSGTDYVATFTPTANSTVSGTVTVAAGSFTDAAGNGNVAGALAPPITIDTVAPTVAITSSAPALKAGETATITFTLSEASTSFAVGDVSVTGGTLTGFSGSGTDYVATFTPTANSTVSGTVTVAAGSFTDAAGNGNVAGALAPPITIDTVAPTVAIAPVKVKGLFVRGSGWNANYLNLSPFRTVGTDRLGWQLRDGASQVANSATVPWSTVNRISVQFDQAIATPQAAALKLHAVTGTGVQTITPSSVTLLAGGTVAQFAVSTLTTGKYVVSIPATGITDVAGMTVLDGEWTTSVSTFAGGSGDGTAGGIFNFSFNLLVGDVVANGVINGPDRNAVINQLFRPLTASNFRSNLNGDAAISGPDATPTTNQLFRALASLPSPTPPTALGATIGSPTAANVSSTGVRLGATVTSSGGEPVLERGVVLIAGDNGAPEITDPAAITLLSPGSTGLFTVDVTGLTPSTAYRFRAFVRTSVGIVYTSISSFVTTG